jgi:hypothetical protein
LGVVDGGARLGTVAVTTNVHVVPTAGFAGFAPFVVPSNGRRNGWTDRVRSEMMLLPPLIAP